MKHTTNRALDLRRAFERNNPEKPKAASGLPRAAFEAHSR
jgi:hypothetical protein